MQSFGPLESMQELFPREKHQRIDGTEKGSAELQRKHTEKHKRREDTTYAEDPYTTNEPGQSS